MSRQSSRRPSTSAIPDELNSVPLSDSNIWYYPAHPSSDSEDIDVGSQLGNWGKKTHPKARWIRKGKLAAWGPGIEDAQAENKVRQRLAAVLPKPPQPKRPKTPTLPHLCALDKPYPIPPPRNHLTYSSYVLDKSTTHSFRSPLLQELEGSTNSLIEGEADMRKALGRLWVVMSRATEEDEDGAGIKVEEDEDDGMSRGDERPAIHKLFLFPSTDNPLQQGSHFSSPETQLGNLEKALVNLREMQDDNREYVERLQEIRELLGESRSHSDGIWTFVREQALLEMQGTIRDMGR